MCVSNRDNSKNIQSSSRRLSEVNRQGVTVLPYAPDTDVRIMDNFYAHSLESSLYSLSVEDHSIPRSRDRINSFDSSSSSNSTFSLAPRTSYASESRRPGLVLERKASKGVIVHPPSNGRAVVEFVFDNIPDELKFPNL